MGKEEQEEREGKRRSQIYTLLQFEVELVSKQQVLRPKQGKDHLAEKGTWPRLDFLHFFKLSLDHNRSLPHTLCNLTECCLYNLDNDNDKPTFFIKQAGVESRAEL